MLLLLLWLQVWFSWTCLTKRSENCRFICNVLCMQTFASLLMDNELVFPFSVEEEQPLHSWSFCHLSGCRDSETFFFLLYKESRAVSKVLIFAQFSSSTSQVIKKGHLAAGVHAAIQEFSRYSRREAWWFNAPSPGYWPGSATAVMVFPLFLNPIGLNTSRKDQHGLIAQEWQDAI